MPAESNSGEAVLSPCMIEITDNIPFLWRLSVDDSPEGVCVVSMVVPFSTGNENLEHTIETSVHSSSCEGFFSEEEEMLEWNEDDMSLFMTLITSLQMRRQQPLGETLKVDLTDPEIIDIVHIVAAAGFGTPYNAENVLLQPRLSHLNFKLEIGSRVSLQTVDGYKACVIVDMEENNVVCVLLDKIDVVVPGEYDCLQVHDLLLVNKQDVLHPQYTKNTPSEFDTLH